jgi:glycosyltransferase involved in cell wall biosynthesis
MFVRRYGIYLAYGPGVDLAAEGLGRYLLAFLKAAQERTDVKFVIACPSWMRKTLIELFKEDNIRAEAIEIVAPAKQPLILTAVERYRYYRSRPKRRLVRWPLLRINPLLRIAVERIERRIASTRSKFFVFWLVLCGTALALFLSTATLVVVVLAKLLFEARKVFRRVFSWLGIYSWLSWLQTAAVAYRNSLAIRLYSRMEENEASLMKQLVDERDEIVAWYCPTAFWPSFNDLSDARVMCVPDVVVRAFPIAFAALTNRRFIDSFKQVEEAIERGRNYITYSRDVKERILIAEYGIDPNSIDVVLHGANRLDENIFVSGFPDNDAATNIFCRRLFASALRKAVDCPNAEAFAGEGIRFMVYASQFRPNKNILGLLRAYDWLLRHRFIGLKLVLTGDPRVLPEISQFIKSRRLQDDVLCLHKLTTRELAACFRLAELAVNPSLSEGGFPFTYSEALSVGTPVVMARIPVTEEILVDPGVADATLFDGYQWRDIAAKIEWALANRSALYLLQKRFYDELISTRTWQKVVAEHIAIFDRIANGVNIGSIPLD